jgi:hypothetical protein
MLLLFVMHVYDGQTTTQAMQLPAALRAPPTSSRGKLLAVRKTCRAMLSLLVPTARGGT